MSKRYRQVVLVFTLACLMWMFAVPVGAKTVLNVVVHWGASAPQMKVFQANAARYMELNPDIQIQIINAPMHSYEGISKLLLLIGGAETNPDIVHSYSAITSELLAGGVFASMPDSMAKDARRFFVPQVLQDQTYKGQLYGIPTENNTYILGYNSRIFDESGIGSAPASWKELQTTARKMTQVNADGSVKQYGLTFGGSYILLAHALITLIWGNGGEYVTEAGKVQLNSSPVTEVVQSLTDMVLSNNAVVKASGGLVKGNNAMSIMATYERQTLANSGSSDYQYLRSMIIPPNKGQPVAYHYSYGFYVSKQSRNAEEAWRFLRWLTMERGESGRTRMGDQMATIGSMPTNAVDISARAEIHKDPFYEGFLPSLNVARSEPLLPEMSRRHQMISDAIGPVFRGTTSVSSALEQLQQQIETTLAQHK